MFQLVSGKQQHSSMTNISKKSSPQVIKSSSISKLVVTTASENPPHHLKIKLCLVSGEAIHANCTCVAGNVGFCNHVLALMIKICKFSLYECKTVNALNNEADMHPKQACTSKLQQWHQKGREDCISPQAVMDVKESKTRVEDTSKSPKDPGVKCLI